MKPKRPGFLDVFDRKGEKDNRHLLLNSSVASFGYSVAPGLAEANDDQNDKDSENVNIEASKNEAVFEAMFEDDAGDGKLQAAPIQLDVGHLAETQGDPAVTPPADLPKVPETSSPAEKPKVTERTAPTRSASNDMKDHVHSSIKKRGAKATRSSDPLRCASTHERSHRSRRTTRRDSNERKRSTSLERPSSATPEPRPGRVTRRAAIGDPAAPPPSLEGEPASVPDSQRSSNRRHSNEGKRSSSSQRIDESAHEPRPGRVTRRAAIGDAAAPSPSLEVDPVTPNPQRVSRRGGLMAAGGASETPEAATLPSTSPSKQRSLRGNRHRETSERRERTAEKSMHRRQSNGGRRKSRKADRGMSSSATMLKKRKDELDKRHAQLKKELSAVDAQLGLIETLPLMTQEEVVEHIFKAVDTDNDGAIDPTELAVALQKKNDSDIAVCFEKAVNMVAAFDGSGTANLDTEEFTVCLEGLANLAGSDMEPFLHEFALDLADCSKDDDFNDDLPSKEEAASQVQRHRELLATLKNPRLEELYSLFDKDGSGELTFRTVALGLYKVSLKMDKTAQAAIKVLLLMDANDERKLPFEEFAKLIMAVVASAGTTFETVADDLASALEEGAEVSTEDLEQMFVSPIDTAAVESTSPSGLEKMLGGDQLGGNSDTLSNARLEKLFDLWDSNGTGSISYTDLESGLRKFQEATDMDDAVEEQAEFLLAFDRTGSGSLGKQEFAQAMAYYAKSNEIDINELINFVCVSTVASDDVSVDFSVLGSMVGLVAGAKRRGGRRPNKTGS